MWERALLTVHAVGYLAVVFLVLSPVKAVVFIVVQQGLFGLYLGCSFAPNHKGMPILAAGDQSDFLRRQVLTSRNVRGGWLTDFALGGLNYQIEHHLFPSMPTAQPAPLAGHDRGVLPAARRAVLPDQPGGLAMRRRCVTSMPSAGQPARQRRPERRPAGRPPHAPMRPGWPRGFTCSCALRVLATLNSARCGNPSGVHGQYLHVRSPDKD